VLSRSELGHVLEAAREKETSPPAAADQAPAVVRTVPAPAPFGAIAIAFVLGALLGAGAVWLALGR